MEIKHILDEFTDHLPPINTIELSEVGKTFNLYPVLVDFIDTYKSFNTAFNSSNLAKVVYDITELENYERHFIDMKKVSRKLYASARVYTLWLEIDDESMQHYLDIFSQQICRLDYVPSFLMDKNVNNRLYKIGRHLVYEEDITVSYLAKYQGWELRVSPKDLNHVGVLLHDAYYYYTKSIIIDNDNGFDKNQEANMQLILSINRLFAYLGIKLKNITC